MMQQIGEQDRWNGMSDALRKSQSLAAAGQHAAAVMHDINNPLEAALNLAYLICEESNDSNKVREYVELLQEQLSSVSVIARNTLSFYKVPAAMHDTDLVEVAQAAMRVHEYKMSSRGLQLAKDLPVDAVVRGHSGELLQVLSNLISNAMDALPEKGSISIRIRKTKREAHFMIVDNGGGITERNLARIFEPFFTTKDEQGTGLGLAISKSIIERHQGRMRARSSVRNGKSGTIFRISLPLAPAAQAVDFR